MTIELTNIIEAMLFAAERPLTTREMRSILAEATDEDNPVMAESFRNIREAQIATALEQLKIACDTQPRSYQLVEIAGGWRLVSRPEFAPWLKKLLDESRPHRLSQPSLETLAIIALRQPISRADIAAIRGVEVDGVIKTLLERDLITIVGRNENIPGRPLLYGTTQRFLEHFGLPNLDDMPKATELRLQAAALRTAEQKALQPTMTAIEPSASAADAATATGTVAPPERIDEGQTTTPAQED